MKKGRRCVWVSMVGLMVLSSLLLSCTQSVEKDPVFRTKMKELTNLQEEVSQLKDQLRRLSTDIEAMREELTTVKQQPTAATSVDAKEISQLRKQVAELSTALSAEKKAPVKIAETGAALTTETKVAPAVKKTQVVKKVTKETYAVPKGIYYRVKPEDTIEKIAQNYKLSVNDILMANRIPKAKRLIPGQQIFIPTKK